MKYYLQQYKEIIEAVNLKINILQIKFKVKILIRIPLLNQVELIKILSMLNKIMIHKIHKTLFKKMTSRLFNLRNNNHFKKMKKFLSYNNLNLNRMKLYMMLHMILK